jgi:hypothetical protein
MALAGHPADAIKTNGIWSFAQPKRVLCETQMMMAIAVVKDGKWAGWISPKQRVAVGGSCQEGPAQVRLPSRRHATGWRWI